MPDAGRTHGPPATKKQAAVTTGKAGTTGIPCTMVLTAAPCSPRGSGLVGPRRSRRNVSRELDPSVGGSGPHGLAVRPRLTRLAKRERPSHPAPTNVALRVRPSNGTGRAN